MVSKERSRVFVLYDSNERIFNQFDREESYLGAQLATRNGDKPEKRLVEDVERELAPVGKYPVGITFDNIMQYGDSNPANSDGAEQRHIYAIPLFSHEVVRQLEGRLLDYIDATYAEKDQREAQKRVVRKILWGYHEELTNARKNAYERSKLVTE